MAIKVSTTVNDFNISNVGSDNGGFVLGISSAGYRNKFRSCYNL